MALLAELTRYVRCIIIMRYASVKRDTNFTGICKRVWNTMVNIKYTLYTIIFYLLLIILNLFEDDCDGITCGTNQKCKIHNNRPSCWCKDGYTRNSDTEICEREGNMEKRYNNLSFARQKTHCFLEYLIQICSILISLDFIYIFHFFFVHNFSSREVCFSETVRYSDHSCILY